MYIAALKKSENKSIFDQDDVKDLEDFDDKLNCY